MSALLRRQRDGAERALEAEVAAAEAAPPAPALGGGQPVDPRLRAVAEARLGRDLRHVRVHADSQANRAASAIGANAFTRGTHIWLGPGRSALDQRLLLHELTHVVQQAEGRAAGLEGMGGEPSVRGALEAEADAVSRSGAAVSRSAGEAGSAVIVPSVGVGAAPIQADVASDLQHEASIGYRADARAELYAQRQRLRAICRSATPDEAAVLVRRLRSRGDPLTTALRHRFHVAVQREILSILERRAAAAPPPAPVQPAPVQPAPQPEPEAAAPEPPMLIDPGSPQEIAWQREMARRREEARRQRIASEATGGGAGEHHAEPPANVPAPAEQPPVPEDEGLAATMAQWIVGSFTNAALADIPPWRLQTFRRQQPFFAPGTLQHRAGSSEAGEAALRHQDTRVAEQVQNTGESVVWGAGQAANIINGLQSAAGDIVPVVAELNRAADSARRVVARAPRPAPPRPSRGRPDLRVIEGGRGRGPTPTRPRPVTPARPVPVQETLPAAVGDGLAVQPGAPITQPRPVAARPYNPRQRGAYWRSIDEGHATQPFPTGRNATPGRRTRGMGRGGVTRYDRPLSAEELEQLRQRWFEEMLERGTPRREVEGRMRNAGINPATPRWRRILDQLWGPSNE